MQCNTLQCSVWLTWPPPGLWLALASEPILGWTPHRLGEGAVPTTIRFIGTGEEGGGRRIGKINGE